MHDTERERIFGEWLVGHKGILFKVVHAYAFEHADRQDLFQEVAVQVWRTQDAAPLHDVNKTLLHLALRQDEAKLQKARRIERGIIYVASVGVVAAMALFLALMIYFHGHRPEKGVTGWDYALPIVGAAAALLAGGAMYGGHRAQARREQRFDESLRYQLRRSIAQLEARAPIARVTLVSVLLWGICPMAILLWRINDKSLSDDGYLLGTLAFLLVWSVASSVWWYRRHAREAWPLKRRLEALLQELDGQ